MADLLQMSCAGCAQARSRAGLFIAVWLLACSFPGQASDAASARPRSTNQISPTPALLKISGYGLFGNRELKQMIRTVELGGKRPPFFPAVFVEDTALMLTARVKRDGYLKPEIRIDMELENGEKIQTDAEDLLENPLPRPLKIRRVHFRIREGVLYHYQNLTFEGLETISEKQARAYFVETGALLSLKRNRVYTPEKLRHGLASLNDVLDRQGYQQARVQVAENRQDDKTGAVTVHVQVQQGLRSMVRSVQEQIFDSGEERPAHSQMVYPNRPYSSVWLQDFRQGLRTNEFHQGYPDVTVEVRTVRQEAQDGKQLLDLHAAVHRGPQVRIGEVRFEGQKKARRSLLQRRVRIHRGELLDRVRVEEGRFRLAQLGTFDRVDLNYEPVDEHRRNVLYRVNEGKRIDISLLAGYGSYELLRGGFEIEQFNIWGRAHHARLKAVQSFKASSVDFTYTLPELIGKDLDVFFNASGLRREEISFTREEYGGGFGAHKFFKPIATDVSVRYNYQILNAANLNETIAKEGITNSSVGAIITEIKHDRRDNPLYPRKGYKVFATLELASEYLAGDVNYQRLELLTSWHEPLGGGRTFSIGISHGVVLTIGSPAEDLPFNRRFFPGGQNSIRGYSEGEASPREQGKFVGSETYSLATVEFEQALTPKWSLVIFSDSLGFARQASHYPFDTGLFSAGGGLRWKTIIGPVRVEYGYNLNPRPADPAGTLQFSLGFPF